MELECIKARFSEKFGKTPMVMSQAPGRVNLIGGSTDYNRGFVMPIAIDRRVTVAAQPRDDNLLNIYSMNFDKNYSADLAAGLKPTDQEPWANYLLGVGVQLERLGIPLCGADVLVYGDIPLGAGLSSSAAYEVAAGLMFEEMLGFEMTRTQMARLCQRAEHEFAGSKCGIMDQFVSLLAHKDHALFIDCDSLDYKQIPFHIAGYQLVVVNTNVKHNLANSAYNSRRVECALAVEVFRAFLRDDIRSLRDCSLTDLRAIEDKLVGKLKMRSRHVITENSRVLSAIDALERDDFEAFGSLLFQSHYSLRDDYEVSCKELDILVAIAEKCEGVLGSRLTGGGFGGCTVSIVENGSVESFKNAIATEYKELSGLDAELFTFQPEDGARIVR